MRRPFRYVGKDSSAFLVQSHKYEYAFARSFAPVTELAVHGGAGAGDLWKNDTDGANAI